MAGQHSFMLNNPGLSLSIFGGLLLVLFVARHVLQAITHRRRARRLGCAPAPLQSTGFPLGLPKVLEMLKADEAHRFPQYLQEENQGIKQKFGCNTQTVESSVLGQRRFMTTDPVNVRAILATQFKEFGLGKPRNDCLALLQGYGVFSSDGEQWEHSRAMLRPQFAREQIDDLSLQAKHSEHMMQAIDVSVDIKTGWSQPIDIQQIFFRFTMDSSTEFLFGTSLDSQLGPFNKSSAAYDIDFDEAAFIEAFDASLDHMTRGLRLGAFYKLAHTKEAKRVCAVVQGFVDKYVQAALDRRAQAESKPGEKRRYVLADALVEETKDPVEIRNQLLNVLIAGRDTTASLLGWLFLLLARQPEEYKRLRTEILQTFGSYEDPRNLTHTGLRSCTLLQHCLNEALRLFPLVPINLRKCLVPFTTLPRGGGPLGQDPIYVRADDDVFYTTVNMHRDVAFWGADAHDFRPARWQTVKPGWQFLPFNGGPRICLGQQFAINQASFVMVRLLQRFDDVIGVDLPSPGEELHHLTVTDACATGVKVKLRRAQG